MYLNDGNITVNSSVIGTQSDVKSNMFHIVNGVSIFIAFVGVVFGCFVVNIVRKLDDDELRSRFSLQCVLVCDVIMAVSGFSGIIFFLTLVDERRFNHLTCPFVYFNMVTGVLFSIALVLALLCLAIDQVIAVFKALYFRTSDGTKRKVVYGTVIFSSVPLASAILIYWTLEAIKGSDNTASCKFLMNVLSDSMEYQLVFVISIAFCTPMIYVAVLWRISRQRGVHSENVLESIQNRRLVISFLLLSASYILLWIPTLVYFSVCYYSDEGCWGKDSIDLSLIMQVIFTLNYVVDPLTCAIRMEPIRQSIVLVLRRR